MTDTRWFRHTPGPWSLSSGWRPDPHAIVDTQNVYGTAPAGVVAHVVMASQDGNHTAERKANARLIAKAPEPLDQLRALLEMLERDVPRHACPGFDCATCARPNIDGAVALLKELDA